MGMYKATTKKDWRMNMKKIKKVSMVITTIAASVLFGCAVSAAPTGLKQIGDATNAVAIDWDDTTIAGVSNYAVFVSRDKDNWTAETMVQESSGYVSASEARISKLNPGSSYYVKVTEAAWDSKNQEVVLGEWSDPIEIVTKPDDASFIGATVKQTAAKKGKVSISWPAVNGATGYEVKVSKNNTDADATVFADVTGTSLDISTSSPTYVGVYYYRRSSTGYVAKCTEGREAYRTSIKPLPGKAKKPKIEGENVVGGVNVKFTAINNCDGYQVQYCKYNGKGKKNKYTSISQLSLASLNKKMFYKVRARGYVVLSSGQKVYGKWSKYNVFCMDQTRHNCKIADASSTSTKKVKISWKKVKGAKNYTVYMSTSRYSGYKAVTTTKGTSVTLSSFNGSGFAYYKNYYYYVVANAKVGKKTYKSLKENRDGFHFYKKYY